MLAYVFWHWPYAGHAEDEYDGAQRDFHRALASSAPRGFISSRVFKVHGKAPWLGGAPAYADWYLVEDSAALDPLNVAAVSGVCEEPHARLTRGMAAGAGSLLQLRSGEADLSAARWLTWLVKPREMPYDAFYAAHASAPGSLWRRQMVLGPNPEFALLSPSRSDAQDTFQPLRLELQPLW